MVGGNGLGRVFCFDFEAVGDIVVVDHDFG